MKQAPKRQKVTPTSTINEICESVNSITKTLDSIKETHTTLLKTNRIYVEYIVDTKKNKQKALLEKIAPETLQKQPTIEKG